MRGADAFSRLTREIGDERAAALRRIAARLEALIAELAALRAAVAAAEGPARDAAQRRYYETRAEARRYRWYFEVQREANGFRGHEILDRVYPIPGP